MNERQVIFSITEDTHPRRRIINVEPTLRNIWRAEGGEDIVLAIAANCVRMISTRDGLERAMERFTDLVVNHTKMIHPSVPKE